jgi:hypothetical protein
MKKLTCLTIFLVSVFLFSCNKQNQDFLLGEWELLTKPDNDLMYKWFFTTDKVYVMATDANENEGFTGEIDTCSSGSYILKNGILTLGLPERPCRGSAYNGDWDIQALNENVMALRRETKNGTEWYEFLKVTTETLEEE